MLLKKSTSHTGLHSLFVSNRGDRDWLTSHVFIRKDKSASVIQQMYPKSHRESSESTVTRVSKSLAQSATTKVHDISAVCLMYI